MHHDLVSVVITTYKRPVHILSRALNSVLRQSYSKIEIIIVNDYPENRSLSKEIKKMINEISNKKIIYIEHVKNFGGCIARNSALKVAKGKYIAFLDDDDSWENKKIEEQMKCFHDDVGMVYCQYTLYKENGSIKKSKLSGKQGDVFLELLEENFIGPTSCVMLRSECLKEIGGFDVDLKSCQDYDVWLRMARKWKVSFCNEHLVNYYFQGDNLSRNEEKRKSGFDAIMKKYNIYYEENREIKNKYLNMVAISCLKMKHYQLALNYYIEALKTSFFSKRNVFWVKKGIGYFVTVLKKTIF